MFRGVGICKGGKEIQLGRDRHFSLVTKLTEALPDCTGSCKTEMSLQIVPA